MLKKINSPLGHWSLLLLLSIIWGSSFILMKRGLDAFSFEQVAALRLFMAFVFLAIIGGKFYKSLPLKKLWPLFLTGIIGNGIPAFLFTKAETHLDSAVVGILVAARFLIALILLILFSTKARAGLMDKESWKGGLILGGLMFAGFFLHVGCLVHFSW